MVTDMDVADLDKRLTFKRGGKIGNVHVTLNNFHPIGFNLPRIQICADGLDRGSSHHTS